MNESERDERTSAAKRLERERLHDPSKSSVRGFGRDIFFVVPFRLVLRRSFPLTLPVHVVYFLFFGVRFFLNRERSSTVKFSALIAMRRIEWVGVGGRVGDDIYTTTRSLLNRPHWSLG